MCLLDREQIERETNGRISRERPIVSYCTPSRRAVQLRPRVEKFGAMFLIINSEDVADISNGFLLGSNKQAGFHYQRFSAPRYDLCLKKPVCHSQT